MALHYREWPEDRLVEIAVEGRVTRDDFDQVKPRLEALLAATGGGIRMVEIVYSYDGFDRSVLWDGLEFDWAHIRDFERCAVVSDLAWTGPVTRLASAVMPVTLKSFGLDQRDEARAWARSGDSGHRENT